MPTANNRRAAPHQPKEAEKPDQMLNLQDRKKFILSTFYQHKGRNWTWQPDSSTFHPDGVDCRRNKRGLLVRIKDPCLPPPPPEIIRTEDDALLDIPDNNNDTVLYVGDLSMHPFLFGRQNIEPEGFYW